MIIINGSYIDTGLVSQLPVIFIQGSQTYYMGYMGNKQFFCFLSVSIYHHSRTLSRNYDLLQPDFIVILHCDYLSVFLSSHSTLLPSLTLTCDSSFQHSQR